MGGLVISLLNKTHNRKSFSCDVKALDNYFHNQAGQDSRKRVAVTYVLHEENKNNITGYYTLSATTIELKSLPETVRKKIPSYPCIPATLIGRLAVDKSYKNRGLGELMLVDAMKRAYHTSLEVASFAVVVDPINDSEQFYKKYGFLDLSVTKSKHRLFFPISSIAKL